MKYAFKVTTNGRALLAELMAKEKPLEITRAVFGSGTIDEGSDLADQHELITPVAAGTVIERRHVGDKLYLTAQYDNSTDQTVGMFYLAEFIVYARYPDSGEEVDLLYATLGDYKQPVPGYSETEPPSTWKFPMVMVVSDKITVTYSGAPGLVTYDDLENVELELYTKLKNELSGNSAAVLIKDITIPAAGWTWQRDSDEQGEWVMDEYRYFVDVPVEGAAETQYPSVALHKAALETAKNAGLCPTVQTLAGALRFWAMETPEADMDASVALISPNSSGGGNSGTTYVLPIATATRLGGVKIGSGISVAADGTITASSSGIKPDDMASSEDTEAMLDEVFPKES